jgi:FKBP-type peptidyl-prolyl cis-trans isomerase SlyD
VTDIYPEHVVLDGNHPLAGIAIRLHLKVISVREATLDEIGHGTCGTGFFKLQSDSGDLYGSVPGNDTVH